MQQTHTSQRLHLCSLSAVKSSSRKRQRTCGSPQAQPQHFQHGVQCTLAGSLPKGAEQPLSEQTVQQRSTLDSCMQLKPTLSFLLHPPPSAFMPFCSVNNCPSSTGLPLCLVGSQQWSCCASAQVCQLMHEASGKKHASLVILIMIDCPHLHDIHFMEPRTYW